MTLADFVLALRRKYDCRRDAWDEFLRSKEMMQYREQLMEREVALGFPSTVRRQKEFSENLPVDLEDQTLGRTAELVGRFVESPVSVPICFAQIWTHRLNACATRAPTGERVVLINRGCIPAFAYASLAFADSFLSTPASTAGAYIREDVELFVASLDYLGATRVSEQINVTERQYRILLADDWKAGFSDMLAIAMIGFIIAHEYGHHMLGHQGDAISTGIDIDKKPVTFFRYSREKEFEADAFAWAVLQRLVQEQSKPEYRGDEFWLNKFCLTAPVLIMVIIEAAQTVMSGRPVPNSSVDDTHPSGHERRIALENLVGPHLDDDSRGFLASVNFFLLRSIGRYFEGFWPDGAALIRPPILHPGG